jgi:hypothetical protein
MLHFLSETYWKLPYIWQQIAVAVPIAIGGGLLVEIFARIIGPALLGLPVFPLFH